ncbi:MAG: histidine kinase dimerization/phosphoacceptor domain -containing protein [Cyanobacteriota bacterium]|jgi:PAS domain S-box-containing protein
MEHLLGELRSTLAKMELALATVDEAIVWVNRQGEILWCNAVFDRLLERAHISLLGQGIEAVFPLLLQDGQTPCSYHPFQKALESRVKGRQIYGYWCREPIRWLEIAWSSFLERPEDVESVCCVLTIRDITESRRLAVDMAESQKELAEIRQTNQGLRILETVLDVALAGYWDWNLLTGEEYLSPAFKKMFGYEDHELPNQSSAWQKLIFPEDLAKVDQVFAAHVGSRGQVPFSAEVRYRHKNGSTVWVICSGRVIVWDDQGNPLRAVGCHIDITARKESEDKLRRSLKEKEILLKEIHHRVKNNLLVVSSLLSWQGETLQDPRILQVFEHSQKRVNTLALIHEKLYRSQDLARINLADYLESLVSQLYASLRDERQTIDLRLDLEPMDVNIETATPCGLIVNELVCNAFEHAFPDGRSGTLKLSLSRNQDGLMVLTVQDDGVGFPFNLDLSKTESLGWQLIYLLTEQLEGKIQFRSQGGAGVTLIFRELNYDNRLF